ncbi:MAG: DUF2183 domain-containing protein [Caldilineaceae bacterium]|nr:DUF2183 domain-containing protein [Caldilineaceae bacterium]
MALFRETIAAVGYHIDEVTDRLLAGVRRHTAADPLLLQLMPYYGYGTETWLRLQGRVLQSHHLLAMEKPNPDVDTIWDNLHTMYHRFASKEVADVAVSAHFQAQTLQASSDREGYFAFEFILKQPLATEQLWHSVALTAGTPQSATDAGTGIVPTAATGKVLVPRLTSNFGIISDIDDTVLQTNATNLLKMARIVFLNSAHTRLPFEGVAAFYAALHRGSSGAEQNPIFYVSSSPWNLYDLLVEFMNIHGIPAGPLFLQDYGLEPDKFITASHQAHKLAAIVQIIRSYPDLNFILIGDSGQDDPEIYVDVLQQFPERICAIYIRDVSTAARKTAVETLIAQANQLDVDMLLVADTQAAASHAYSQGWIRSEELSAVQIDQQKDAAAPSDLELLLEKSKPR